MKSTVEKKSLRRSRLFQAVFTLLRRHWLAASASFVLTTGVGVVISFISPKNNPIIRWSYDTMVSLRQFYAPPPPDDVVLISMDDFSHEELNQPYNAPWDRVLHAKLLDRLLAEGVRAVVFDIVFSGPSRPASDESFAEAIRRNGKVVLAVDAIREEGGLFLTKSFEFKEPYSPFASAAAAMGSAEVQADEHDLVVRQHLPVTNEEPFHSLAWAAATLVSGPMPVPSTPRWMNYYGVAHTLPAISYYKVLEGNDLSIPTNFFRGKTVFVGATVFTRSSGERKDEYSSPFLRSGGTGHDFIPGVELQATVFLNLVRHDWFTRLAPLTELGLVLACGLVFGTGLFLLDRSQFAILASVLAAAILCAGSLLLLITQFIWFAWLIPLIQLAVATIFTVSFHGFNHLLQKQRMVHTLAVHLSPARAKVIMGKPELLKPGADLQPITILFTDIANFTKISEQLPPNVLAALLNNYFEASISSIQKTEGMVVKLIGDAIFAIWNAPEPQPDHNQRACQAALLLREQFQKFDRENKHLPTLRTRIGLHTGVACVGNFGSSTRFDYTAIGEHVNLSSRLEGLNKFLGTDILLSDAIYLPVKEQFVARNVGKFRFKGFERFVEVYELLGVPGGVEQNGTWRRFFEDGLSAFQQRRFDVAEKHFQELLRVRPEDGPAQFYLQQIQEMAMAPPESDWNGSVDLKEK